MSAQASVCNAQSGGKVTSKVQNEHTHRHADTQTHRHRHTDTRAHNHTYTRAPCCMAVAITFIETAGGCHSFGSQSKQQRASKRPLASQRGTERVCERERETHTHAHTHAHTCTHTCTHTHMRTHMHAFRRSVEARDATGDVAPRGSDSRCKRAYHAVPEVANVRHGPSCSDAAKNAGQCKRPRPCKLCSKPKKKKGGGGGKR